LLKYVKPSVSSGVSSISLDINLKYDIAFTAVQKLQKFYSQHMYLVNG